MLVQLAKITLSEEEEEEDDEDEDENEEEEEKKTREVRSHRLLYCDIKR